MAMSSSPGVLIVAALATIASGAAASEPPDRPTWTVSGHAGVSTGSTIGPSFAWRAGVHRWVSKGGALGVEVGRHRWDGVGRNLYYPMSLSIEPFGGLQKGGRQLQHVALTLRMHGEGMGPHSSAPLLSFGVGLYQPVGDEAGDRIFQDSTDDKYGVGVSFALGGAATRGIAPGAEIRFDFIDAGSGLVQYFTISAALLGNR